MPTFTQFTAGQFCRELACGIEPLDELLSSWNLTPEDYQQLRHNKWFQKELITAVEEVKDLGPQSAYIMKCRAIAEETLGEVLKIIKNERVDPAVRMGAYKQITDLGRLAAPKTDGQRGGGGPSVVFHFGEGLKFAPAVLEVVSEAPAAPQLEGE